MKQRKDLIELANELFGTTTKKQKAKKFIPIYKTTTYNGISKKWYIKPEGSIKIVNGHEYDWELIKDDYNSVEEFIIKLIKKERDK